MKRVILFAAMFMILCCTNAKNNNANVPQESDYVSVNQETIDEDTGIMESEEILTDNVISASPDTVSVPDKDYLTGKINFSKDSRFVKLNSQHCEGRTIYLITEVAEAFEKMREAALKDGIVLFVLSGTRSFEHQKGIWERKWNNLKNLKPKERAIEILKFSSMPMTSRHHWGTDMDLNSLENSYFERGKGLQTYQWLTKNAPAYGFCQVYTNKSISGRTGYEMEKWHWSYMPISRKLLKEYNNAVKTSDFKGFVGCELVYEINIIEDYVNGISDDCNDMVLDEL